MTVIFINKGRKKEFDSRWSIIYILMGNFLCDDFRRNLDYFLACMQGAVNAVDPETGGGELTVRIPKEVLTCANGRNTIIIQSTLS